MVLQHDKIKRKTVLAPSLATNVNNGTNEEPRLMKTFPPGAANAVDIGAVVGGMEANGVRVLSQIFSSQFVHSTQIQRTPLVNRTGTFPGFQRGSRSSSNGSGEGQGWAQPPAVNAVAHQQSAHPQQRGWGRGTIRQQQQPNRRTSLAVDSTRAGYISDRSDSANEVENLLITGDHGPPYANRVTASGWQAAPNAIQRPRPSAGAQPQRGK
ncbi:hypothetical protein AAF712_002194 [Marasmius tenuissimus]|uniref:Uncharacterized protein n=1 Tax=Marasmius tenuissimus TaxID=585030 RepID=A0ABR3ABN6_9AGAR